MAEVNFMDALANQTNVSVTENGALGYKTTGRSLVDLNFSVPALRRTPPMEIISRFNKAYSEDRDLAMKWLFYLRDVRGGIGERQTFRTIFSFIICNRAQECDADEVLTALKNLVDYGRWDDVLDVLYNALDQDRRKRWLIVLIVGLIDGQLRTDLNLMKHNASISLLAKWMPSINSSSKATRNRAKSLTGLLHYTEKDYRKLLSSLRAYLKVVEVKMSAGQWGDIEYSTVPSKANLIYRKAFLKHDYQRRSGFIAAVNNGTEKVNSGTLFPHEIIHQYLYQQCEDQELEAAWKCLPDFIQGASNTIVVCDTSGSMGCTVDSKSNVRALDVAIALTIYFSERLTPPFKDRFITFESSPHYVDLSSYSTLYGKVDETKHADWGRSTNISAVFDLLLKTAMNNSLPNDQIPNILIISDMEFDYSASPEADHFLFDTIREKYEAVGYTLPKLCFWNVNSRTETIPVKENQNGVILVSGFSAAISKMVLSEKTDPYEALVDILQSDRYKGINAIPSVTSIL